MTTPQKMDLLRESLLSKIISGMDSIARVELPFITPKRNPLSALIQKRCGSIRNKEVRMFYWELLERAMERTPTGNVIQPTTLKIVSSTSEEIRKGMEHNTKNITSRCPANAHWLPKIWEEMTKSEMKTLQTGWATKTCLRVTAVPFWEHSLTRTLWLTWRECWKRVSAIR